MNHNAATHILTKDCVWGNSMIANFTEVTALSYLFHFSQNEWKFSQNLGPELNEPQLNSLEYFDKLCWWWILRPLCGGCSSMQVIFNIFSLGCFYQTNWIPFNSVFQPTQHMRSNSSNQQFIICSKVQYAISIICGHT